jgi:acetyl esterase/lipase
MGESVACAIHFARERASELGSDEPNVVLSGFSGGGGPAAHTALLGSTLEARWDEYGAEGGPLRQVECEVTEGSTHVDALVAMGGAYDLFVPTYDGKYGMAYQQERDPELWRFLSSSIGANPDLQVRLLHGESDGVITYENSVGFEAMLIGAGYDVELTGFDGGHSVPMDLAVPTILEVMGS